MHIWFIKHERSYGPFFSSRQKAIYWLMQDVDDNHSALRLADILTDSDPYTSIVEVELDKEQFFDG